MRNSVTNSLRPVLARFKDASRRSRFADRGLNASDQRRQNLFAENLVGPAFYHELLQRVSGVQLYIAALLSSNVDVQASRL